MSCIPRWAAVGVALLGLSLIPAKAEEPRIGIQLHADLPGGDLKKTVDSKPGAGLGAHVAFDLGGGHVLRPRIDAVFFSGSPFPGFHNKASDLSVGADYLYFLNGKPEGLYLTAGLGLHHWSVEGTAPALGGYPGYSATNTSYRLGYSAGLGYNFNRSLGAELRLVDTQYNLGSGFNSSAIMGQLGVTVRF